MLEAIYEIGKLDKEEDILKVFIEDIGEKYNNILKINLSIDAKINANGKFERYSALHFLKLNLEEYSKEKKYKYLYKRGGGQKPDLTPTSKITEVKKSIKSLLDSLKSFSNYFEDCFDVNEKKFFKDLIEEISRIKDKLIGDINKFLSEFDIIDKNGKINAKKRVAFTLVFIPSSNNPKYIGDLAVFRESIIKKSGILFDEYYKKYSTISIGKNKECYLCQKVKEEVFGFASPYPFYTVDKKSMVIGGFEQKYAWKNFPVCRECMLTLIKGKKYLDNNLRFFFCQTNYLLIPEMIGYDKDLFLDIIKKLRDYKKFSLKKENVMSINDTETNILRVLSGYYNTEEDEFSRIFLEDNNSSTVKSNKINNSVLFHFLFFQEEQSGSVFKILLHIKNIPPSRLVQLIKAKEEIDELNKNIFKPIKTKKGYFYFDFRFSFIRDFFPVKSNDGTFTKYFLAILDNIFIGKKITEHLLFNRFLSLFRKYFLNYKK